jgi:murein DD-endopeptidase MepM/ murein hydrolase activator NlpD
MTHRAARLGISLLIAFTACSSFLATGGCTNGDESSNNLAAAGPFQTGDEHGDDSVGDLSTPPDDDPALGADTVDAPAPGPDAAPDADAGAAPAVSGGSCVPGGVYCGGDKVIGDAKTLYKCNGPGAPTVVTKCAYGCSVNAGNDDSCKPAPGSRVASPVPGKVVTYPYGVKNSGYAAGYHTGEDYATPTGSNAVAVRSGTIRWSNDNGGAYGKWMGLDADNGRTYVYCHLSSRLVASGTKVVAGQPLAKTGATGNVTGPHLHFEDHPLGPFVYAQVRKPSW